MLLVLFFFLINKFIIMDAATYLHLKEHLGLLITEEIKKEHLWAPSNFNILKSYFFFFFFFNSMIFHN